MPFSDLPLIDLHRHLDGNVRLQTIIDLAREHDIELPGDTVESLRPHVQVMGVEADLVSWLGKLAWMTRVMVNPAACERVAYENVLDAASEGIDYVELRFSPYFMAEPNQLDPEAVTEAVVAGIERGRAKSGLPVQLIGVLSRTYGPEAARIELEALLAHRDALVAIDLAGDELNWPPELFVEHFRRSRDAGLEITVHAGEAGQAEGIRTAIDRLGATRIGHGIRAIDDPRLMDLLAERGIGLEINLTSNVQTSTVPNLAEHPMKEFLARGLLATLNTDDPVVSGIDLRHEYEVAAPAAGLTPALIRQAQENALEIAFLSKDEKKRLRAAKLESTAPA